MSEHICKGCPYKEKDECEDGGYYYSKAIEDALELLKEQKQIFVHSSKYHGIMYAECPKCHERIDSIVNKHFCGNCGQAVKWTGTTEGR